MTRKTTTLMLDSTGCAGGSAHTVEKVLQEVTGVLRAYVNPATETAYVEYDADQCNETDLARAVESVGVNSLNPAVPRHLDVVPLTCPSKGVHMREKRFRSGTWWAFAGFAAIAGFFFVTEQRAHLFSVLPYLFLLACLFVHRLGHGGHGRHRGHGDNDGYAVNMQEGNARDRDQAFQNGLYGQPSRRHQHLSSAARDDRSS